MKKRFSEDLFVAAPVVGILRGFTYDEIKQFIPVYIEAGLRTIEVTMNSAEPAYTIQRLVAEFGDRLNIGAGTVCEMAELQAAIEAGASFIVSPNTSEEIIAGAVEKNVAVMPGAFTPTEIYKAMKAGATAVKLFPASCISPVYVKDIKGPFPDVKLIPTGGIGLGNIDAFMNAGAYGVGLGSQLFDKKLIHQGRREELYNHFRQFYERVQKH